MAFTAVDDESPLLELLLAGEAMEEEFTRIPEASGQIVARLRIRSESMAMNSELLKAWEEARTTFLAANIVKEDGTIASAVAKEHKEEEKRAKAELLSSCWWLPLASIFRRLNPRPIPFGEPLDFLQLQRLEEEHRRAMVPGHFKKLTMDGRLVMDCLHHYNSMHLGDEYESAPGKVTQHYRMHNGIRWTHGNFVARRKRSGFLSFLPAPRTLFFFELAFKDGFNQVVTCTPLLDEPVTEAYSVLGFPLWWSTRRSGRLDCICKTCNRRLEVLHPDMKIFACGHKEVEKICKMCSRGSDVLHPYPGEFEFGHHNSY